MGPDMMGRCPAHILKPAVVRLLQASKRVSRRMRQVPLAHRPRAVAASNLLARGLDMSIRHSHAYIEGACARHAGGGALPEAAPKSNSSSSGSRRPLSSCAKSASRGSVKSSFSRSSLNRSILHTKGATTPGVGCGKAHELLVREVVGRVVVGQEQKESETVYGNYTHPALIH